MRFCVFLAALLLSIPAFAQTVSVNQIVQFVRSAIQLKQPDKQVAATLQHMKLSEKLGDRTIEDLQGDGAGPKTVAALKELSAGSQNLTAAAPPTPKKVYVPPPPPSYEDQQRILNEVREYAQNYSKSLPDYICKQVTRRYFDPFGKENWRAADVITSKLTYFEQKEKYQTLLVNGRMLDTPMEKLGGTTSSGEFGSLLNGVFAAKSDAEFHWERWGRLRGRVCHVYTYSVDQAHSDWGILDAESKRSIVPAYRGEVFVDKNTNEVLRVSLESIDIPADFPIQVAKDTLDYDYVDISGHKFLLPFKSELRLDRGRFQSRNDVDFHSYQKYSAEAVITFDTPEAPEDNKTKEEPPK